MIKSWTFREFIWIGAVSLSDRIATFLLEIASLCWFCHKDLSLLCRSGLVTVCTIWAMKRLKSKLCSKLRNEIQIQMGCICKPVCMCRVCWRCASASCQASDLHEFEWWICKPFRYPPSLYHSMHQQQQPGYTESRILSICLLLHWRRDV